MRAIGLILAGGSSSRMKELTMNRATAALPIAGGYRSIDFALSSMSSSHINKVGVITQYNSKSLTQHLNSSKWWDFGRKKGGLFVFTPTQTHDNSYWYRGTADAIAQNIDFLKSSHEPYVIIASGDCVYKMDMNKLLEYHIGKNSDITIVTKDLGTMDDPSRFGVVSVDEDGRVTEFEEKPIVTSKTLVSTGIYVIRRRQLIELIQEEDDLEYLEEDDMTVTPGRRKKKAPKPEKAPQTTSELSLENASLWDIHKAKKKQNATETQEICNKKNNKT